MRLMELWLEQGYDIKLRGMLDQNNYTFIEYAILNY